MISSAIAQSMATEQGRLFEMSCDLALRCAGFQLDNVRVTFKQIGVEVDITATNKFGIPFYFTCKGSMRGTRPGARRTDTLKKAICDAFLLSQAGLTPVILLTSHIPDTGSGRAMLNSLPRDVLFDALNPWIHGERLCWLAIADKTALDTDMRYSLRELCETNWPAVKQQLSNSAQTRFHFPQLELFSQQVA